MIARTMSSMSVAVMVAVTKEAKRALGGKHEVRITHFPFKVGRESRSPNSVLTRVTELRLGVAAELNDVYLQEPPWSDLLQISREHFAIEYDGSQFVLVDRDSMCGTIVAGTQVGGNRLGGRTELRSGNEIIVGSFGSEYVFRFECIAGST